MSRSSLFQKCVSYIIGDKREAPKNYVEQRIAHAETMMTGDFQSMFGDQFLVRLEPKFDAVSGNQGECVLEVEDLRNKTINQYKGILYVQDNPQYTAETCWGLAGQIPVDLTSRGKRSMLLNGLGADLNLKRITPQHMADPQGRVMGGVNPRLVR